MDKRAETIEAKELESLNNTTWEDLNPDWLEDGDLTSRFAKSQFDNCPGCGNFEQLKVYNTSHDEQGASVLCLPCGWQVNGETPSEAIQNWNTRAVHLSQSRDAWTPIRSEDDLPEVGIVVLWATEPGCYPMLGYLDGERLRVYRIGGSSWENRFYFKAWRPLPTPYDQEK
jgi:hypothetical protein